MTFDHNKILRFMGATKPIPHPLFVLYTVALVTFLQYPASFVLHNVSLGLGVMLNELVIAAGIPILFVYLLEFDRKKLFPFSKPKPLSWLPLFFLVLGMVILIDFLTAGSEAILPLPEKYKKIFEWLLAVDSPKQYAYKFVLLCILPGICEEIFFRGYCQTAIAQRWGVTYSIIVTGAIFALLHGNIWHIHLYFLLGCFLSWVYAVSGTLWVPIACHIFNNAWTMTNHTFDTTLPWTNMSFAFNAAILIAGILMILVGGSLFLKTSK